MRAAATPAPCSYGPDCIKDLNYADANAKIELLAGNLQRNKIYLI